MTRAAFATLLALAGLALPASAFAETTRVAVAANFTDAAQEIARAFEEETGHAAEMSFGATGMLYTQIDQGAPFEVFLSADGDRPALAVEEGHAVAGTLFTYATGTLALYSKGPDLVTGPETLEADNWESIAIANPETAPYGAAAVQVMKALGVYNHLEGSMVQGSSIAQAFQFVETENAALGFVSLSQVAGIESGSRWIVPADLHDPIRQDAVLLTNGEGKPAAEAFLQFLKGERAGEIIEARGYARGR